MLDTQRKVMWLSLWKISDQNVSPSQEVDSAYSKPYHVVLQDITQLESVLIVNLALGLVVHFYNNFVKVSNWSKEIKVNFC